MKVILYRQCEMKMYLINLLINVPGLTVHDLSVHLILKNMFS